MGPVAQRSSAALLDLVFGVDAVGGKPEERALNSSRRFVRSQVQLAFATPQAKGRVLTAHEALQTFGWDNLLRVAMEGSAPLVRSANEPASTLNEQRSALGLSITDLSKRTGVGEADIAAAETPGAFSAIRTLERLGQALALDERRLGYQPNAGRDSDLGVRLRELKQAADVNVFGPATVLGLTEAAWVISRQAYLSKALQFISPQRVELPVPEANYSYPAFRVGYSLAERTRDLLGLSIDQPIESLRALIEEVLELPLVQQTMDTRFAGATISNGDVRGIVVNERGMNSNVWVRRMTLCHEVGHLLWDPDTYLAKLKVDEYSNIEESDSEQRRDPVEIRANAFAVAFLAPPHGVMRIVQSCNGDPTESVSRVMTTYGISGSAAKHHVYNVANLNTSTVFVPALPSPTSNWVVQEELSIAYFPIASTPITRRGKFAWFVAKHFEGGLLSEDTCASYLKCDPGDISKHLGTILSMWPDA